MGFDLELELFNHAGGHPKFRASGLILVPTSGGAEPRGIRPAGIMAAGRTWEKAVGRTSSLSTEHRPCIVLFPVADGKICSLLLWGCYGVAPKLRAHPSVFSLSVLQ